MIALVRYWKPLSALVLAALLYGWGYYTARTAGLVALQVERNRYERAMADMARAEAEAQAKARNAEQEAAARVAEVGARYERELDEAKAAGARVAADLERGSLRLRREIGALYTERLSSGAAAAGELSAEARRGAELVAAAIAVGARCDAQVTGLQDAYEAASKQ
jgi:hypothetical protein